MASISDDDKACASDLEFFRTRITDVNNKAIELLIENDRLKARAASIQPVYRDTDATLEKLRTNVKTIRNLNARITDLRTTLLNQAPALRAEFDELRGIADEEVRCLKATIDVHLGTIGDQGRMIETLAARSTKPVYRETEATREHLRINAATIILQAAQIEKQTETNDTLYRTNERLLATIAELRGIAAAHEEEERALDVRLIERLRKEAKDRDEDLERYRKRIFALDIDVGNLKDWLAEAEKERDQLQKRLDDLEDPPIREQQRRDDIGARGVTEVRAHAWRQEVNRE